MPNAEVAVASPLPAAFPDKLEQLLAESEAGAAKREREAFDQAAYPFERKIVIYGAGGLGRKVLSALRANGLDALAFADRNPSAWQLLLEGLPVLPPDQAIQRYAQDATFVVAVCNAGTRGGVSAITRELKAAGCRRVVPFLSLAWKYSEAILPHFLWDLPSRILHAAPAVRRACALFAEPRSQNEFLAQLEFRLTGDPDCLIPPEDDVQYFPRQLFRPRSDECFVDCGAYDGDTLRALLTWTGGQYRRAIAFEADPANFAALGRTVHEEERLQSRVRMVHAAVGARREKLRFAASGLVSSSLSTNGDIEVDALPLDEALAEETATFIKMDIEGSEKAALEGAARVMRRDQPLMAVCLYHLQEHLWSLPLFLNEHLPDAHFFLRPYAYNGFELVCYAVPPGRL